MLVLLPPIREKLLVTWTGWVITSRLVELRCTGSARRTNIFRRSDMTDYFYVTSEAREGCEHAS